jgi:hypothetical protein
LQTYTSSRRITRHDGIDSKFDDGGICLGDTMSWLSDPITMSPKKLKHKEKICQQQISYYGVI